MVLSKQARVRVLGSMRVYLKARFRCWVPVLGGSAICKQWLGSWYLVLGLVLSKNANNLQVVKTTKYLAVC